MRNLFYLIVIIGIIFPSFIPNVSAQYSTKQDSAISISGEKSLAHIGELCISHASDNSTYVAWQQLENINGNSIVTVRLQRLDKDGNYIWSKDGILISSKPITISDYSNYINLKVTSKNEAIVSVVDNRQHKHSSGITLYKISPNKEFLWGQDGMNVYHNATNSVQQEISLKVNMEDEVVLAVPTVSELIINKITPNANIKNSDHTVLKGANTKPIIVTGKAGKFYVVYRQQNAIYADLYDNECKLIWNAVYIGNETGVGITLNDDCLAESDSEGNLIVMWKKNKLYLQKINEKGERLFSNDGLLVSTDAVTISNPVFSIDNTLKNIYISWYNNNTTNFAIRSQKISFEGKKIWDIIVDDVHSASVMNTPVTIVHTNNNKAILVLLKFNTSKQIYELIAVKLEDSVENNNFNNYKVIHSSKSTKYSIVSTGYFNNQLVFAWYDDSSAVSGKQNIKIKMQNISYHGVLGPGAGEAHIDDKFYLENDILTVCPNPVFNGRFRISLAVPNDVLGNIKIFDVNGKLCFTLNNFHLYQENNELEVNLDNGIYYIEVQTENSNFYKKIIVQ